MKFHDIQLGDTIDTEYPEEYVARFLWGHEGHNSDYMIGFGGLFLKHPCVKEPILSAFGKIAPEYVICNRNINPRNWRKFFLFAEKTNRIWSTIMNIIIPVEEKLFLMFDENRAKRYQVDALHFTNTKTWKEFITSRESVILPTPYHTHPKILEACKNPIQFARMMSAKNGNIFRGVCSGLYRLEMPD